MGMNALWWWIDRWRKSTAFTDMTLEEQGAYRNLLDEGTLRGGAIPNDERILAKACGDATKWKRVRPAVMSRFELRDDGWHNETLDRVIRESEQRAEKQRRYRNAKGNGVGNAERNGPVDIGGNNTRPPDPITGSRAGKAPALPRRPVENREPDEGSFALYAKIAQEARRISFEQDESESISNIAAIFKQLCATRKLAYDGDLASRAIAAVMTASQVGAA